jgi:drug/metabolite transporter (DMT)-like permease
MKTTPLKWLYLFTLALIWGSSFMLIKKGLVGLTPIQLGSLRIIFASLFLLLIGFKSLSKIPLHQWKYIALTATLGTFLPAYLFSVAQTQIDSSVSAILNSLTPLNTMILGGIAFGASFKRIQIIGVIIGLFGTLLLIINGAIHHPEQNYYYAILVIVASICYATNVNLIKKYLSDLSPVSITTGNFLILLLPALIILLFSGFLDNIALDNVSNSVAYIVILGVVGTGIANILFFKTIQIGNLFNSDSCFLMGIIRRRNSYSYSVFWGLYCFDWSLFGCKKIKSQQP